MRKVIVRKNRWLTLVVGLFFFLIVGLEIYFIDPAMVKDVVVPSSYLTFFVPLLLALFFTLGALFQNSRRSIFTSLAIIIFLYLRIFGLGTALNLVLLLAITVSLEYYFSSTQKKSIT